MCGGAARHAGVVAGRLHRSRSSPSARSVYVYRGDSDARSYAPTYAGHEWPLVAVPPGCAVAAPPSLAANLTVAPGSRVLRLNGLSLYQWSGEESSIACGCNFPDEGWSSLGPDGAGSAFAVQPVAVPAGARDGGVPIGSDYLPNDAGGASSLGNLAADPPTGRALRQHGLLMLVAWAGLLPAGAALGRLIQFGGVGAGGGAAVGVAPEPAPSPAPAPRPLLLRGHALVQVCGAAAATAGFAVVLRRLRDPFKELSDLPLSHGSVGVAAMALLYAQLGLGLARPHPGPGRRRAVWEQAHGLVGRAALAVGAANAFAGIAVAHQLLVLGGAARWAGGAAASLGAVWALGGAAQKAAEQRRRWRLGGCAGGCGGAAAAADADGSGGGGAAAAAHECGEG